MDYGDFSVTFALAWWTLCLFVAGRPRVPRRISVPLFFAGPIGALAFLLPGFFGRS